MIRTGYIGGSDLSDILGLGDYACKLRCWLSKRGVEGEELTSRHIRRGTELEAMVLKWYSEERGIEIQPHPHVIKEGWMGARVDGKALENSKPGNVEAKVPSRITWHRYRREGLPEGYIVQMNWYLGILEWEYGLYAIFNADLFQFADEGRERFEVAFNDRLFQACKAEAFAFWGLVENGPAPEKLDRDSKPCISCRYRQHCHSEAATVEIEQGPTVFSDDPAIMQGIRAYAEFSAIERAAKEEKDAAAEAVLALAPAGKVITPAGSVGAEFRSKRFQMKALEAERPKLAQILKARYTVDDKETQRRITPKKG